MQTTFSVRTRSREELVDITAQVESAIKRLEATAGVVTVYCPHTTAGITINENADPSVCRDILETLRRLVPAGQSHFQHAEGNADSHVKSSLVGCSEQLLVEDGRLSLGTWQGIFLAEFDGPRSRTVHVGIIEGQIP